MLRPYGIFSALSGLAALTLAGPVAGLLGLATPLIVRIVGAVLLLYAADLLLTARRDPFPRAKVWYFTAMDAAWVVGTGVVLALVSFPGPGAALLVAIALTVGAFGVLQFRALRSGQATATAAGVV